MTTKAKKTAGKKAGKKLALNKETIRDLSAENRAGAVRGGMMNLTSPETACAACPTKARGC